MYNMYNGESKLKELFQNKKINCTATCSKATFTKKSKFSLLQNQVQFQIFRFLIKKRYKSGIFEFLGNDPI